MNLFVGNLNPQTSEDSLRTLFSEFGEIVSVKIPIDNETGLPRGFGFVEMTDRFESYDAIDNIDGIYFEGQVISVKESKPKNGQGGNNRGNSRGGFRSNNGGGGYRSNDRSGGGGYRSNDRSSGGGFRSNDRSGGGGFRRSYDNDRSDSGGGFRRSYDNDRSDNRGANSDDPNKQPGRRFSPRGPRPGQG
ncbi:MAG TPA: RNA-binding protein [Flavipsychrobacter sp.]